MADTKKEYTSNLHPKGDLDTTVYPNVKSENIIDKDTTAYTAGKVPDSSLVSKSLDGLNEKIETNKIQTETNKTNIATLQGDVSTLKSDNQTTKTTIAGLVSSDTTNKANIAKNTQNIDNLSAVMPTDINVDANCYAILEHDGTEITGQKKQIPILWNYHQYLTTTYTDKIDLTIPSPFTSKLLKGMFNINLTNKDSTSKNAKTVVEILPIIGNDVSKDGYFKIEVDPSTHNIFISNISNVGRGIYLVIPYSYTSYSIVLPKKNGTIALTSDIEGKQDKRFVHTVEIHYASNGSYFCFTGQSDKNTPIDSVEDLTTVFANRDFCGTGIFGSAGLSKIHVGSSINDTTFKQYMNNGQYANPNEETFAMVFNTTGFTITDSVSAL